MKVPSVKSLLFSFLALGFLFEIQDSLPGNPLYKNPTFIAPKVRAISSCQTLVDAFCAQIAANAGELNIWMGRENVSLHTPRDLQQSVKRAQIAALRAGKAPSDFIKNLERSYLAKMETELNRSPASLPNDREVAHLKDQYQHAIEHTIAERLKADPALTPEKAKEDLEITLRRSIWEQNENFLRAKKEFNEVKSAYLAYFSDKTELLQKIRAIEFKVPDEILGDMTASCNESQWQTFYQPDKNYMSVCAGLLTSGQSLVYSFDKQFSQLAETSPLFTQILEKRYSGHANKTVQLRRNFVLANAAMLCKETERKISFFTPDLQKSLNCE